MTSPWTTTPTLIGRHVTLRPMKRDDREALLEAFADGLAHVFYTFVPSSSTIDGLFDQLEREHQAGRTLAFTVLDAEGRVSGMTRLMRLARAHRRVEIGGTVYASRVQRTGLNTEAKRLLLTYAFETLGCHVVQLRTDWLNLRSRAAIERLGAKMDGVLRGHLIMPDGHIRDSVVYSIIASEWPGVRARLDMLLAREPVI